MAGLEVTTEIIRGDLIVVDAGVLATALLDDHDRNTPDLPLGLDDGEGDVAGLTAIENG